MEKSLLSEPAFTSLSESTVKEPSLQVPLAVVPLRVTLSFQTLNFTYSAGFPKRNPPSRFPSQSSHRQALCFQSRSSSVSQSSW
jgi:hypothetical protein